MRKSETGANNNHCNNHSVNIDFCLPRNQIELHSGQYRVIPSPVLPKSLTKYCIFSWEVCVVQ